MSEKSGFTAIPDVIEHLRGKNTWPASNGTAYHTKAPIGECPICHDVHFVHPVGADGTPDFSQVIPCECVRERFERERLQRILRLCELPPGAEHMTFDKFLVKPGLEEAYEAARQMAEGHSESNWLTLISDVDRGKTHLLVAICHHWIQRGQPARYAYVPLLLDELRRGFKSDDPDYEYESRFAFYLNVPLLALDDLGTEHRTAWVQERLNTLIEHRLMHKLALVVSTNLTMDEMSFRVGSRLKRNGKIVFIDAPEFTASREVSQCP